MKIDVNIDPKARHSDGFSRVMVNITDLNIQRELDISFLELYRRCGIPDLITLDFLLVAVDLILCRNPQESITGSSRLSTQSFAKFSIEDT